MLIQKEMKLADVIHHDHNLIPVLNRFDIHLGFGDASIENICREEGVNTDFFLTIINAYHDHEYFPKEHLQHFNASLIVNYLNKTHRYYLDLKIPEIEELISHLDDSGEMDATTFSLLKNFYEEYKNELTQHIQREDEKVYPYVLQLEEALATGKVPAELRNMMADYPIGSYEEEHDNVEEKLYDLKNLLIKYVPGLKNDQLLFNILRELFTLENDLNDHSRIEDMILVPKVEQMEQMLKARKE